MTVIIDALISILTSVFGPIWNGVLKRKMNKHSFVYEQLNECYEPLFDELFRKKRYFKPSEKYFQNVIGKLIENKTKYLTIDTGNCYYESVEREKTISSLFEYNTKAVDKINEITDKDPNYNPDDLIRKAWDCNKNHDKEYQEMITKFMDLVKKDYDELKIKFQRNPILSHKTTDNN